MIFRPDSYYALGITEISFPPAHVRSAQYNTNDPQREKIRTYTLNTTELNWFGTEVINPT